ncbi:MAG: helix-turn-helix transcriptional regulator [Ilumatobacteraceae bacterium]
MADTAKPDWTFLTNHAQVLACIADEPDIRGRDIAERVGITERAAQSIIADLVSCGYITRTREGRRNRYAINPDGRLRHPLQDDHTIGELLTAIGRLRPTRRKKPA